jgi:hypothetical protein
LGKSKYKATENPSDVGKRNAQLERSREQLMGAVVKYKELLDDTVLLSNRTQPEKKALSDLLYDLNNFALEVDTRSVGEGSRVIGSTALNSLLLLSDQLNQLKYHNYYLTKRIEALEAELPNAEEQEEESNEPSEES